VWIDAKLIFPSQVGRLGLSTFRLWITLHCIIEKKFYLCIVKSIKNMYNQTDINEVDGFIMGMKIATKQTTEEEFRMGSKIPNTEIFLLKRTNNEGEVEYGFGGGAVSNHGFERYIESELIKKAIENEGNTILCKCETTLNGNRFKVKFTNYLTKEEHEENHEFNRGPFQVSDINSFMGQPLCLN